MNNIAILNTNETLTMSSREIAELTGKRHDNVRADVQSLAEELSLTFQEKVEATAGRPSKVYLLPKRETLILVSGYSATMRAAIIDRWQALEAQVKPAFVIPQTFGEALMLAGKLEQERQTLALENAIAKPKAEFFDELVDNSTVFTPTQVAHTIADKRYNTAQKVNLLLCDMGWQYKRGNQWVAYADVIKDGYMQSKVYTNADTGHSGCNTRVTATGLNFIRQHIAA